MTDEQQARELARWLEAGGGTDLPSAVHPDVLEAVLALRPDLAPAPRVSIDDILADVRTGPFADAPAISGGEVVPFPVPSSLPPDDPMLDAPVPANRPWWAGRATGGLAGVVAAAAAVLLVLGDPNTTLEMADTTLPAAIEEAASEQAAVPESSDSRREKFDARQDKTPPPPPAAPRAQRETKEARKWEVAKSPARQAKPAPAPALTGAIAKDEPKKKRASVEPMGPPGDDAVVDLGEMPTYSAAGDDLDDQGNTASFGSGGGSADGLSAPIAELPADDKELDQVAATEDEEVRAPDVEQVQSLDIPVTTSTETLAPSSKTARSPYAAAPSELPRSGAGPTPLQIALEGSAARAASGDPVGAARSLQGFIREPVSDGQRAAEAAARYALQGGQPALALDLIQRGLALTSKRSGARRRLLELEELASSQLAPRQTAEPNE